MEKKKITFLKKKLLKVHIFMKKDIRNKILIFIFVFSLKKKVKCTHFT